MKRTPGFTADDGTWFATAKECKQHEQLAFVDLLKNLPPSRIFDALDRIDIPLAAAFERAGAIIAAKRLASGELKRTKKADTPMLRKSKAPDTKTAIDKIKENMKDLS
jgi:hypothetical protein